jgi:ABC-2 type transport system permease protein
MMIFLVTCSAVAFGGIGSAIALKSGKASVVQGLFPLVFVILFLSTAFFPEQLLLEPARSVAAWNPLSFVVEAVRDPVISAFSAKLFFEGLLAVSLVGAFGLVMSALALRSRLRTGG